MACQGARGRSRHTTPIVSTELRPPLHSGQPPRAETPPILPLPLRLILILLLSRLSPSLSPPRSRSPPLLLLLLLPSLSLSLSLPDATSSSPSSSSPSASRAVFFLLQSFARSPSLEGLRQSGAAAKWPRAVTNKRQCDSTVGSGKRENKGRGWIQEGPKRRFFGPERGDAN